MDWFQDEDLLGMPNWAWVVMVLVIIIASSSFMSVLLISK
jgi:hypothetical protein